MAMANVENDCWAIIPAAGVGSRFGSDMPKQYFSVAGKSILQHSVERVLAAPQINSVIVCVAADDELGQQQSIAQLPRVKSTFGGETRAQSVLNGLRFLESLADDNDWVLVHDAARPLLSYASLRQLIEHCAEHQRGAILASASVNTLKQVDSRNRISATLDRTMVWQAQTPQMFHLGQLRDALSSALNNSKEITDEASAMELAGFEVDVVASSGNNFKLTSPSDLPLLEFLMQAEPSNIDV